MKKILYGTLFTLGSFMSAFAQETVEAFPSLEVGFTTTEELPAGVVLGVNGPVYIQAGTQYDNQTPEDYDPATGIIGRDVKAEYINDFLLWVEKGVVCEDVAVADHDIWLADYVFAEDYELTTLLELESYVTANKHLPNVISQKEVDAQGFYRVNDMLIGQLQNLEELVLHSIAQEKTLKVQEQEQQQLIELIASLERQLDKLEAQANRE